MSVFASIPVSTSSVSAARSSRRSDSAPSQRLAPTPPNRATYTPTLGTPSTRSEEPLPTLRKSVPSNTTKNASSGSSISRGTRKISPVYQARTRATLRKFLTKPRKQDSTPITLRGMGKAHSTGENPKPDTSSAKTNTLSARICPN